MHKNRFNNDDSLIISNLEQKELEDKNQIKNFDLFLEPILTEVEFLPFINNLPIKIGLSIKILGRNIYQSSIRKGYFYHNLESLITDFNIPKNIEIMRRIKPSQSIFYQLSYLLCIENLFGLEIPKSELLKRSVAIEIARTYHNLYVLKNIFTCLKINNLKNNCEHILLYGSNLFDIFKHIESNEQVDKISNIKNAHKLLEILLNMATNLELDTNNSEILYKKLIYKAKITLHQACDLGLSGRFLQACKNFSMPINNNSIYISDPPNISLRDEADAYARCMLRVDEIKSSLAWLIRQINHLEEFEKNLVALSVEEKDFDISGIKNSFAFSELNSPEGDLKSSIFVNSKREISYKITSPAYFIVQSIPHMLLKADFDDIPLILASLGIDEFEIDK
jgi:Ni,Fe-hydrogenase III large subunit